MADVVKLVKLTVVENATQKNVIGKKNWIAVKKQAGQVTLEVTTSPKNNADEWKHVVWSGDKGQPVPGKPNRRRLSLTASKKFHIEAALGGVKDFIDVWVLWAAIDIKIQGARPAGAAPFDPNTRDNSDRLGAVTYKSMTSSVIDEAAGVFVDNMGASGKVAPVATLTPKGIGKIVKAGLTFEREVWSHNWSDGHKTKQSNTQWTRDTSKPKYQRLVPDKEDRIYDLDAPDIRWGQNSYETHNNFRQWIEWNQTKYSDYALWYWQARWRVNKDMRKQITLNKLGTGNIKLPVSPRYTPSRSP